MHISPTATLVGTMLVLTCASAQDETGEEKRRSMIVIGKRQVLSGPKAFPSFCRKNAREKRSTLRKNVIRDLKALASADRSKLIDLVTDPDVRPLWVVNAVVAKMTTSEVSPFALCMFIMLTPWPIVGGPISIKPN